MATLKIQCALDGLVDARRTDEIHAEWMSSEAIAPINRIV
jgi:hypothetical protein